MNNFFTYFAEANICPICKKNLKQPNAFLKKTCSDPYHSFNESTIEFRDIDHHRMIITLIRLKKDKSYVVLENKYGPTLFGNLDDSDLYVENVEATIQKLKDILYSTLKKIKLNEMFR